MACFGILGGQIFFNFFFFPKYFLKFFLKFFFLLKLYSFTHSFTQFFCVLLGCVSVRRCAFLFLGINNQVVNCIHTMDFASLRRRRCSV